MNYAKRYNDKCRKHSRPQYRNASDAPEYESIVYSFLITKIYIYLTRGLKAGQILRHLAAIFNHSYRSAFSNSKCKTDHIHFPLFC